MPADVLVDIWSLQCNSVIFRDYMSTSVSASKATSFISQSFRCSLVSMFFLFFDPYLSLKFLFFPSTCYTHAV